MDLHATGGGYYSGGGGLRLYIRLYFGEATIGGGLLNKGGVYLRKYGMYRCAHVVVCVQVFRCVCGPNWRDFPKLFDLLAGRLTPAARVEVHVIKQSVPSM